MKRIGKSKEPTVKRLQNIAENLKDHLKTYAAASVEAKRYDYTDHTITEYGIYIASDGRATHKFDTWEELLSFYHKLMKEKV